MGLFWNQRTFCLITGASRGIGKCIAVEFAKKVGAGSVLLLVAQSAAGLEETKAEILGNSSNSDVKVVTAAMDLGGGRKDGDYLDMIEAALITTGTTASQFELSLLVHNAGSLGNVRLKMIEMESLAELRAYYEFNLFSMILLTTEFFKVFNDDGKERNVVQISSQGAVEPIKTWGYYCAGKAARDMLMRSIATEDPTIATLSYAPGQVDTDMYTAAMRSGDAEVAMEFQKGKAAGRVMAPIQTITTLIRILEEKKYRNGEHVHYYDVEN